MEAEAAAADHHAYAAGVGAAGGEDLHRQVSAHRPLLLCLRLWVVGPRCRSVGCVDVAQWAVWLGVDVAQWAVWLGVDVAQWAVWLGVDVAQWVVWM